MADDDETVDGLKAKPRPSMNPELNLNAVIAPAQNAVVLSSEIVDFFSDAIAKADLSKKPVNTGTQYAVLTCVQLSRMLGRVCHYPALAGSCFPHLQAISISSFVELRRGKFDMAAGLAAETNSDRFHSSSFGIRMVARAVLWPAGLNQGRKSDMKWISFGLLAPVALAILALSISAPMLSSSAYASKMNGKGSPCSDRNCRGINSSNYGKKSDKKSTSH
jgi:hypothetical protein